MLSDRDKDNIRTLRDLGFGYKAIAKQLSLKKHAVRDYCRYWGLTGYGRLQLAETIRNNLKCYSVLEKWQCKNCGNTITRRWGTSGRQKKFCSDKCRYAYRNKRLKNNEINNVFERSSDDFSHSGN